MPDVKLALNRIVNHDQTAAAASVPTASGVNLAVEKLWDRGEGLGKIRSGDAGILEAYDTLRCYEAGNETDSFKEVPCKASWAECIEGVDVGGGDGGECGPGVCPGTPATRS